MNGFETSFENIAVSAETGFSVRFVTKDHNSPLHWHRELEILYILNGHAAVVMDGVRHEINPQQAIVMDYSQIHEVFYALPQTMGICIHISKQLERRYLSDAELLEIHCCGDAVPREKEEAYREILACLKELTILYVNQKNTYRMRSNALILQMMAALVESFSEPVTRGGMAAKAGNMERLEKICGFVERHYREEISLQQAAEELGLNREYFCRFFKQNTGTSFLRYVNQVRIGHIYQDLLHTDDSVGEIMERHGFYNQKLFHRMFKERYGCTPRELRRMGEEELAQGL